MKIMPVFHIGASFSLNMCTIIAAAAAGSQPVNSLAISPIANSTAMSLAAKSVNLTATQFFVPGTSMRIDFQHYNPPLALADVLMCLIMSLSGAYLHAADERLPEYSSHSHSIAINIEDSGHPIPGYPFTYVDLVTTLTGIGLYMSGYERYTTSLFRIYDVSEAAVPVLLGTGEMREDFLNNGSVISPEGLGAAVTETPPVGTS